MTIRPASATLVLFFAATVAFFSVSAPRFATATNIENLMSGFSFVAILAMGQAFPILVRGIDLSIGAIVGVVGMIVLGFITKFPVPFYTTMENAAKAYAAAHPGVEIVYGQGTSATDIDGQIAPIESMVTKGVKGLAITPVDPAVAPALDKAVAAGVKVVLMDNSILNWKGQTSLATTNNYNAGVLAGQYLKTVVRRQARHPRRRARCARARWSREGHDGRAEGRRRQHRGKGTTSCTEESGINVAQDILTANPDVKAIYSACGPPAAGAAQAIKNAKLNRHVILVGFDFCCGEPEAMAAGQEDASVAQFPAKMAELGVDALVKSMRGKKVESLIDSGAALVTKDNMDKFK